MCIAWHVAMYRTNCSMLWECGLRIELFFLRGTLVSKEYKGYRYVQIMSQIPSHITSEDFCSEAISASSFLLRKSVKRPVNVAIAATFGPKS